MSHTTFTLPMVLISLAAAGLAPRSAAMPEEILATAGPTQLTGPVAAAPGYVRLGLRNTSDSMMAYELVRLRPGVTPEAGARAVRVYHRLEPGDTAQARALFQGFHGGPVYVAPGETKWVGTTLEPGTYVSYADIITDRGPPVLRAGHVSPLLVRTGGRGAVAPEPEHTLRMRDFGFEGPRTVPAGRALWRVENGGRAVHLAFVARLAEGRTLDDLKASFAAREPGLPAALDRRFGLVGVHALSTGLYNDVELDLPAGEYVIGCVIDGHHMLGMLAPLTVTP
ncbi:MAG TPA: hypothetical protein VEB59_08435 [Gemmatimonadales bacterium]|nr:hypothetical protein [Gemmatimonadales bacterium]